jgi:hypothetical protein
MALIERIPNMYVIKDAVVVEKFYLREIKESIFGHVFKSLFSNESKFCFMVNRLQINDATYIGQN